MSESGSVDEIEEKIGFISMKKAIMQDGAIDKRTKRLIALASAAAMGCDQCVVRHKGYAREAGISEDEITESILVASLIRMGAGLKYMEEK